RASRRAAPAPAGPDRAGSSSPSSMGSADAAKSRGPPRACTWVGERIWFGEQPIVLFAHTVQHCDVDSSVLVLGSEPHGGGAVKQVGVKDDRSILSVWNNHRAGILSE